MLNRSNKSRFQSQLISAVSETGTVNFTAKTAKLKREERKVIDVSRLGATFSESEESNKLKRRSNLRCEGKVIANNYTNFTMLDRLISSRFPYSN